MKSSLSPKEMAAAVGVSESSLKRWTDDGRINAVRTAGGHRRIPVSEAIRFAREARMPIQRPDLLGLPTLDRSTQASGRRDPSAALEDALVAGDAIRAQAILVDLYLAPRSPSIASICDGPVRLALTAIGEIWEHDETGIMVEHRATDICVQALNVLRALQSRPPEPGETEPIADDRPVALGGAAAGDPYLIPSLMCSCVLTELGYRAINLGPDTPLSTLHIAFQQHRPKLAWLSCASPEHVPGPDDIIALADHLATWKGALAIGGRVLSDGDLPSHACLTHCQTMGDLNQFARGLLAR